MITLKQYGRMVHIEEPIDEKLNNYLYKSLSYMKKNARFMPNPLFGMVHLYNKNKRYFPLGLLNKVQVILDEWVKQTGEDYELKIDRKKYIVKLVDKCDDLRDYQNEALGEMLANDGGMLVLPTGAGKTIVAVKYLELCDENVRKLIVVPTTDLRTQWENQLKHIENIRVATYQKLYRELSDLHIYDIVIFDECHHVSARTIYRVGMACRNATMIGLTATPKRDDGEDMKLQAVLGDVIYSIPIQKLVEGGHLVPAKVYMIDVPNMELTFFDDYRDIVMQCIVNNDIRNKKIIEIAKRECENGTVIIMVDLIEHGNKLLQMFDDNTKKVVFVNGKSKDRDEVFQKAIDNNFDVIMATKIYGEGVNIPNLKTMILAGGGKGTTKIIQQTGRILRNFKGKDYASIYDFKDKVKILKGHVNKRLKIYKDNGFEVIE